MTDQTKPQTDTQTETQTEQTEQNPHRARLVANHKLLIECGQIRQNRAELVAKVDKAPMLAKAGLVTEIAYASLEVETRLLQAVQNLSALAADLIPTEQTEGATNGETIH